MKQTRDLKNLEENNYMTKFIEKPIRLPNLIELVADTISQTEQPRSSTTTR
jgi:FixJ family two-component response regulator